MPSILFYYIIGIYLRFRQSRFPSHADTTDHQGGLLRIPLDDNAPPPTGRQSAQLSGL